jgi:L-amino acid N-acyltransferase YncA
MRLRFASVRDDAAIAAIYAPVVATTAISFEVVAPDAAAMRSRIAAQPADKPWVVAEIDDAVAGYAYASSFRGRAAYRFGVEVGVYVAEGARRRGAGAALYRALLALLESQGYRRAFAGIALPNDPSLALHRAAGFTEAGIVHAAGFKFDRWHDVAFYERALAPIGVPARDPRGIDELDASEVRAAFALNDSR